MNRRLNVIEDIIDVQNSYRHILSVNEAETRWKLIDRFLLDFLGFSREDIIVEYSVDSDDRIGRYDHIDYTVNIFNKPKLLVEAKSLGTDLFEHYDQLRGYFSRIIDEYHYGRNELIGILTDGDSILLYSDIKTEGIMDNSPFYTIKLSNSEESELVKLLNYSKENLLREESKPIIETDDEYELYVPYRVDMLENAINYFKSKGIEVKIDKIYLRGRLYRKFGSLKVLYRNLLKEINILEPYLIYNLIEEDSIDFNGVARKKFSKESICKEEVVVKTKQGEVYCSLDNSISGMLNRIVTLLEHSHFGLYNVEISLTDLNNS